MSVEDAKSREPVDFAEPVTERVFQLRRRVGPRRWDRVAGEAQERLRVVKEMQQRAPGESRRKRLARIAPKVHWSTYSHWRRKFEVRDGPEWERLVDTRVPPSPARSEEHTSELQSLRHLV